MDHQDLARRRLFAQRLAGAPLRTPEAVVRHLGAVQAQDWLGAKWAIARRCPGVTSADLDQALADGRLLRTHVLRPTWHVVAPADLRDWLALSAPRVKAMNASYDKVVGVDDALAARAQAVFAEALAGGQALTRDELAAALAAAGIAPEERMAHLVMRAELDMVLVSGPMTGKRHTYMAFDARVPAGPAFDREAALARLAKTYFASHGPASAQDFAWWSGLRVADAKAGLALAGDALAEVAPGLWAAADGPDGALPAPCLHLLPNYDELFVGVAERAAALEPGCGLSTTGRNGMLFSHLLMRGGRAIAAWRRDVGAKAAAVAVQGEPALSPAERAALEAEAARFGTFLGLPASLKC